MTLYELSAEWLDGMVISGGILVQWQKHAATRHTPFKLNFGRHLWKGNLTVKMELPKLEDFLK